MEQHFPIYIDSEFYIEWYLDWGLSISWDYCSVTHARKLLFGTVLYCIHQNNSYYLDKQSNKDMPPEEGTMKIYSWLPKIIILQVMRVHACYSVLHIFLKASKVAANLVVTRFNAQWPILSALLPLGSSRPAGKAMTEAIIAEKISLPCSPSGTS